MAYIKQWKMPDGTVYDIKAAQYKITESNAYSGNTSNLNANNYGTITGFWLDWIEGYAGDITNSPNAGAHNALLITGKYSYGKVQLWLSCNDNGLYYRNRLDSSSSTSSDWRVVLTSANYTSYCATTGHTHSYLPLSGGTMSGDINWSNYGAITFPSGTNTTTTTSTPTALSFGRLQCWGTLSINADTDGSQSEYVIITSGRGKSDSTSDGLAVGYNSLTWQGSTVLTSANYGGHTHHISSVYWYGSENLLCYDANNEWSIDMQASATGSYFHIWSGVLGNSCMQFYNDNGICKAPYGVYGGLWNDYAEYRSAESIEPGYCVKEDHDGVMKLTTKRLEEGCEIISDTFGFAIGESDVCKTPVATAGRVLAYPYEDRSSYQLGKPVCSAPDGKISQMTDEEARQYPWCILGTVSEIPDYEEWGEVKKAVNGRIWIRIR